MFPFPRALRVRGLVPAMMMATGLAATLAAGGLTAASPAMAQQAAAPSAQQLALAKELVIANGEVRAFDGVIDNIVDGAALSFLQTNPDLVQRLREAALTVRPEFEKRKDEIVDILAKVYASRFTQAELTAALAFYKSPVGVKLVTERPVIVQEAIRAVQVWGGAMNAEAVERVRAVMKQKGFDI